jgi:hypothetical protein
MANGIATISNTVTPYAAEFTNTEDGGAITIGGQQINVLAALTAAGFNATNSPLFAGLNQAFASTADAQAYVDANVDIIVYNTASAVDTSVALYNANMTLGAGVAGNFRINATTVKAGAATFTERVRVALRHSIVR